MSINGLWTNFKIIYLHVVTVIKLFDSFSTLWYFSVFVILGDISVLMYPECTVW